MPGDVAQLRLLAKRIFGKLQQPRPDHAPPVPEVGKVAKIETGPVGRSLQQLKAFRVSLHHAIFDAVVNHFDKMSCACRATVEIALRGGKGFEHGHELLINRLLSTDHETVAELEAPDAAAHARIEKVETPFREPFAPAQIIPVIGVGAVNNNVSRLEERSELFQVLIDDLPRRQHQPDDPRWCELLDHLGQRVGAVRPLCCQPLGLVR